jgi:hypothetical protein
LQVDARTTAKIKARLARIAALRDNKATARSADDKR